MRVTRQKERNKERPRCWRFILALGAAGIGATMLMLGATGTGAAAQVQLVVEEQSINVPYAYCWDDSSSDPDRPFSPYSDAACNVQHEAAERWSLFDLEDADVSNPNCRVDRSDINISPGAQRNVRSEALLKKYVVDGTGEVVGRQLAINAGFGDGPGRGVVQATAYKTNWSAPNRTVPLEFRATGRSTSPSDLLSVVEVQLAENAGPTGAVMSTQWAVRIRRDTKRVEVFRATATEPYAWRPVGAPLAEASLDDTDVSVTVVAGTDGTYEGAIEIFVAASGTTHTRNVDGIRAGVRGPFPDWAPSTTFSLEASSSGTGGVCRVRNGTAVVHYDLRRSGINCAPQLGLGLSFCRLVSNDDDLHVEKCLGQPVTVFLANGDVPTNGDDVILGTDRPDTVNGLRGNDLICTNGGDDIIWGAAGNDQIEAGGGNDTVYGGSGADVLRGDDGADEIFGQQGPDSLYGGDGPDELYGGPGYDAVYGEAGDDIVHGAGGNDRLWGGAGDDAIYGKPGNDTMWGGPGADQMYGSTGADLMYGEAGDDRLQGASGNDEIYGGNGRDLLYGQSNNDKLYGGGMADTLYGASGNDILRGGAGNDNLQGGGGDDNLDGGAGVDISYGQAGSDTCASDPGETVFC